VAHHCSAPRGNPVHAGNFGGVVPPVVAAPSMVLPAGSASQGLQHADELDAGFPPLASHSGSSDDGTLAESASVMSLVRPLMALILWWLVRVLLPLLFYLKLSLMIGLMSWTSLSRSVVSQFFQIVDWVRLHAVVN